MSTEEVIYWGWAVPKHIKNKSSYWITSFNWNNEVLVVSNNNTKIDQSAMLTLLDIRSHVRSISLGMACLPFILSKNMLLKNFYAIT